MRTSSLTRWIGAERATTALTAPAPGGRALQAVLAVVVAVVGCGGVVRGWSHGRPLAAPRQGAGRLVVLRDRFVRQEGVTDFVAVNPDGTGRRVVGPRSHRRELEPSSRAAWSPDARLIAYVADEDPFHQRYRAVTDVYVMGADGSRPRRLTSTRDASAPLWSPDGRTIVFTREQHPGRVPPTATLWAMDADGGHQRRLFAPVEGRIDVAGSFSPDGARLAFTRSTYVPETQHGLVRTTDAVYVARARGGAPRRLADHAADPAWSPDGRVIAFASDRDRNGLVAAGEDENKVADELYVMDADGRQPRRLTHTRNREERMPVWSPDGRRIAYQREFDAPQIHTIVMTVDPDGSHQTPIAADTRRRALLNGTATTYEQPAWRPGPVLRP